MKRVKELYDFYKNQSNIEELDMIFERKQGKENLLYSNPELLQRILFYIQQAYPKRSKLRGMNLQSITDSKFCKDGYIYILRGDYKNCEVGFYSLPYALTGKNVEELSQELTPNEADYLCSNHPNSLTRTDLPDKTMDAFIQRQTRGGGGPFISTTTNFNSAHYFASTKNGEIYVIKVKVDDIIPAPIKVNTGFEECEFLIPDYIEMGEVCVKFDYRDYLGIMEYLSKIVGLEISHSDLLPEVSRGDEFAYRELISSGVNLPNLEDIVPKKAKQQ